MPSSLSGSFLDNIYFDSGLESKPQLYAYLEHLVVDQPTKAGVFEEFLNLLTNFRESYEYNPDGFLRLLQQVMAYSYQVSPQFYGEVVYYYYFISYIKALNTVESACKEAEKSIEYNQGHGLDFKELVNNRTLNVKHLHPWLMDSGQILKFEDEKDIEFIRGVMESVNNTTHLESLFILASQGLQQLKTVFGLDYKMMYLVNSQMQFNRHISTLVSTAHFLTGYNYASLVSYPEYYPYRKQVRLSFKTEEALNNLYLTAIKQRSIYNFFFQNIPDSKIEDLGLQVPIISLQTTVNHIYTVLTQTNLQRVLEGLMLYRVKIKKLNTELEQLMTKLRAHRSNLDQINTPDQNAFISVGLDIDFEVSALLLKVGDIKQELDILFAIVEDFKELPFQVERAFAPYDLYLRDIHANMLDPINSLKTLITTYYTQSQTHINFLSTDLKSSLTAALQKPVVKDNLNLGSAYEKTILVLDQALDGFQELTAILSRTPCTIKTFEDLHKTIKVILARKEKEANKQQALESENRAIVSDLKYQMHNSLTEVYKKLSKGGVVSLARLLRNNLQDDLVSPAKVAAYYKALQEALESYWQSIPSNIENYLVSEAESTVEAIKKAEEQSLENLYSKVEKQSCKSVADLEFFDSQTDSGLTILEPEDNVVSKPLKFEAL